MKHVFIINPAAGNGSGLKTLEKLLVPFSDTYSIEIYKTKGPRDATDYIRTRCSAESDTAFRFYACGGDGTLNEVASGIVGFSNASMSCYPCGSGNDFVKAMGGAARFLDLNALLSAEELSIDLMQVNDRYCLNIFNFGFDTTVAETMSLVKRKRLIGGKNAYFTGVAKALFTAMRTRCRVTVDGEALNDKELLLCTVANGTHVGGSFHCAPRARFDDGLLDVCLCRVINHIQFVSMVGAYAKGTHLDDPKCMRYLKYARGRVVEVDAQEGFKATLDGEIVAGTHFRVEVLPGAIRFALPATGS